MRYSNCLPLLVFAILCATCSAQAQDDGTPLINDVPAAKADKPAKDDARQPPAPKIQKPNDAGAADSPPDDILPRIHGKSPTAAADRTTLIDDTAERDSAKTSTGIPENLADALSLALNHSPGIVVAEAKVRQAEAELNEVRQSVVEELTIAYQQWSVEKRLSAALVKKGRASEDSVPLGLVKQEARILYLLGVGRHTPRAGGANARQATAMGAMMGPSGMMAPGMMGLGGMSGGMMPGGMMPGASPLGGPSAQMMGAGAAPSTDVRRKMKSAAAPEPALATGPSSLPATLQEKVSTGVRRFLETRVDMDFAEQPFSDVLQYLETAADSDVVFIPPSASRPDEKEPTVTIRMKHVAIASALQALADIYHYAFVFRDYGILVIGPSKGLRMEAFRASGAPLIAPPEGSPLQD